MANSDIASTKAECDCVIEKLLSSPFSSLSYSQKLQIIQDGPPRPFLNITTQLKSCVRHFNTDLYKSVHWLCGCQKLNRLFCWSCLLFSADKNVWTKLGYNDLNNVHRTQKRHNNSVNHILCEKSLLLFGKNQRIELALNTQDIQSIARHNEKVKQNRQILRHLIGVTCLFGKLCLPFKGHSVSKNKGNFLEFINQIGRNDNVLKNHLDNSSAFRDVSPDIQNDLIYSVSEVITRKIKTEISKTNFVALILDETSELFTMSQLSTTFRYVNENGVVEERFVHFTNVSCDSKADALFQHSLQILRDFNCVNKLVAQSYDGATVMAGQHNDLQTQIQENCPSSTFIHCYAHKLNLVLSQSTSFIKPIKNFFDNLSSFSAFFANSTKRTQALDAHVINGISSIAPTRWNFQSRIVQTVKEYKKDLSSLFQVIIENQNQDWDQESIICSRGLLSLLNDFDFNFFLTVFSEIFPHSEKLFKVLQTKILDIDYCDKQIAEFKSYIQKMENEFNEFWNCMDILVSENQSPSKRIRLDSVPEEDEKLKTTYSRIYYEILNVINLNINQRFGEISKLRFLNLLDSTQFNSYAQHFPDELLYCLLGTYGTFFDADRLKSELIVIYSDIDSKKGGVCELYQYILSLRLDSVFPEVSKLCCLILTIPTTSCIAKNSVSYLNRIKTYLRNSQNQETSALALINIENTLLENMRMSPTFEDTVVNVFAEQNTNQRIELKFKPRLEDISYLDI
ncbi:zinc finger MYM-type protein 1-like [Diabrotica undecimpunctata]|uniref:zinc finger MYM-type protein 1-like n=1 Tax=Diabrotica undecimpunctata TaxID=50387 RepID=UPI003B6348BE